MFKNLLMSILYFAIFIFVATIILTLFNYFNIFGNGLIKILKFVIPMLGVMINCYSLGKKSVRKGYLEGLKFGGIVVLVFGFVALITKSFEFKVIVYYMIILLVASLSSMIGINKKKVTD